MYHKIENDSKPTAGNFVHETQNMDKEFGNVSKLWLDKTLTYEEAAEEMKVSSKDTKDFLIEPKEAMPYMDDNQKVGILVKSEDRVFYPTEHALKQLFTRVGSNPAYACQLLKRDENWTLSQILMYEWERLSLAEGKYILRTNGDSLRAVLTERYNPLSNEFLMEVVKECIPGGRVSHLRGDMDTLLGNVLIPDSIRQEEDSDYGGMVSLTNCEIGTRSFSVLPSLFRAICMNGCIWGQKKGTILKKRHNNRRLNDLEYMREAISACIRDQIPLIEPALKILLEKKTFTTDTTIERLVVASSKELRLTKAETKKVVDERKHIAGKSLFSLIDVYTRAGQKMSSDKWRSLDVFAGRLANYSVNQWEELQHKARLVTDAELEIVL